MPAVALTSSVRLHVMAWLVVSKPPATKMEISALACLLLRGLPVAGSMADRMWAAHVQGQLTADPHKQLGLQALPGKQRSVMCSSSLQCTCSRCNTTSSHIMHTQYMSQQRQPPMLPLIPGCCVMPAAPSYATCCLPAGCHFDTKTVCDSM